MNVTVMGLGLFGGGTGAARHFASRGDRVRVTDLRRERDLAPAIRELSGLDIEYRLGAHPEEIFRDADVLVVNPGVRPDHPLLGVAAAAGARLTTEINLVFELAGSPIAAVTGSNGKSTVAAMLAGCLETSGRRVLLGGNIGGSLLGAVQAFGAGGLLVLELSSFQLERLAWLGRSPHLAIVTNVTPNHLDWHPDFAHYARAKENIARFQTPADFLVVNADCPVAGRWGERARARVGRFSTSARPACPAAWLRSGGLLLDTAGFQERLMTAAELPLPGAHNRANALAAALGAALLGAPAEACRRALAAFRGLPHRLELVGERRGVRFFNDSIATTPEAAVAGLRSFDCPLALIAGGSDKGVDYGEFGREAARRANFVALTGPTGPKIRAAIEAAGERRAHLADARDFDDAVRQAAAAAAPGWVVLLSPASASFDRFPNFTARGERFRQLFRELGD